jgi:hypothetical protein
MVRRPVWVLFAASACAAGLALSPIMSAQAASGPGWRVIYSHHYGAAAAFSTFWSASAAGIRNAWAVGGLTMGGAPGSGRPFAVRWQGSRWHASPLPAGLTSFLIAASADSPSDAWAVSGQGGYVLHWSGRSWSVAKRFPEPKLVRELTGVTAFGPKDVWVFGGSGAYPGEGTWHLHGTTWTKVTGIGGNIARASAVSPSDMWAVGGISVGDDAIVHFAGNRWLHVTAKVLTGLQFHGIVALSKADVWAAAAPQANPLKAFLVHRTGSGWVRVQLPWAVDAGSLASDGRGGLWISAASATRSWLIHRSSSGRWSRVALPNRSGIIGLSPIPGTTSLWGTGSIGQQRGSKATIWASGRIR